MKNYKCLAILTAALLLSSCNAGDGTETTSEQTTTASLVQAETSAADEVISETALETTAAETAVQITTSNQPAETVQTALAETVSVTIRQTDDTLDIPDEDIVENVDAGSVFKSELGVATIYKDKITKEYFILLNVTPQKVYWNETDGYDVTVGQAMDIAVPAIFEEWLVNADGMMIYMGGDGWNKLTNLKFDDRTVMGMSFPQYWSKDYLCPIVGGTVVFGEYTDEINGSFSRVDDGVYIEEANYSYPENPFGDGMSVENLDLYFETIKADHDALKQEMDAHPDTLYEIAGFWGYQDGVRFRADINYIY
ncbi:MAG: hypothetical protein NC253_02750 [Ruminococcus sp.]|nr:hypothetical protein [Ruminococcus sp.]MCM1480945.1 hypothetical protein [Muribaculaceae bacterium]